MVWSASLGDHLDRMARALFEARPAAGAFRVIDTVALAGSEFDDRLLRTRGVAVVAFEAVAAGQTALRLMARLGLAQPGKHLTKA